MHTIETEYKFVKEKLHLRGCDMSGRRPVKPALLLDISPSLSIHNNYRLPDAEDIYTQ